MYGARCENEGGICLMDLEGHLLSTGNLCSYHTHEPESPLTLKRYSPILLLWPTVSTLRFSCLVLLTCPSPATRVFDLSTITLEAPPHKMTSPLVVPVASFKTLVAPIHSLYFFLSYLSSICSPVQFSNVLSFTSVLLQGSTPGTFLLPHSRDRAGRDVTKQYQHRAR